MSPLEQLRIEERDREVAAAETLMANFVLGASWPDTLEATRALAVIHLETLRIVRETAAQVAALAKGRAE